VLFRRWESRNINWRKINFPRSTLTIFRRGIHRVVAGRTELYIDRAEALFLSLSTVGYQINDDYRRYRDDGQQDNSPHSSPPSIGFMICLLLYGVRVIQAT
jgi:hypothetical protein